MRSQQVWRRWLYRRVSSWPAATSERCTIQTIMHQDGSWRGPSLPTRFVAPWVASLRRRRPWWPRRRQRDNLRSVVGGQPKSHEERAAATIVARVAVFVFSDDPEQLRAAVSDFQEEAQHWS